MQSFLLFGLLDFFVKDITHWRDTFFVVFMLFSSSAS